MKTSGVNRDMLLKARQFCKDLYPEFEKTWGANDASLEELAALNTLFASLTTYIALSEARLNRQDDALRAIGFSSSRGGQ